MKAEGRKKKSAPETAPSKDIKSAAPASGEYFKRSKKTNPAVLRAIARLYKISNENKALIWKDVADILKGSTRQKVEVNLDRIARVVNKNETIVVPGKVLGTGSIGIPITVAAFSFSESARRKILSANGRDIGILELADKNPKGSGVRIIR